MVVIVSYGKIIIVSIFYFPFVGNGLDDVFHDCVIRDLQHLRLIK